MLSGMKAKRLLTHAEMSSLGGKARAKKLSAKRRQQIARQAAQARWKMERQVAAVDYRLDEQDALRNNQ